MINLMMVIARDGLVFDFKLLFDVYIFLHCSGVKAVEKKEGGGSHNWGTMKDDME